MLILTMNNNYYVVCVISKLVISSIIAFDHNEPYNFEPLS